MFKDILHVIENHHENLSGEGYPKGLIEDEIDDMTRVISVCDSYDAMTSGRKYQTRKAPLQAVNDLLLKSNIEMRDNPLRNQYGRIEEGYLYDRKVVNAFIEYLVGIGHLVRNENGELCDIEGELDFVIEIEAALAKQERLNNISVPNTLDD